MKIKWAIFPVLAAFVVTAMNLSSAAVSTVAVEAVRNKAVLDDQDKRIIDDFLAEAVRELVRTRDFTSIARLRTVILSMQSTQGQYAQQFSESVLTHIQAGFEQAEELNPEERKTNVIINLLILIDGLADPRLADLAIARLNDQNTVVRYWAVHYLTNPAMIQRLQSRTMSSSTSVATIARQLEGLIDASGPEILAMIARFAASLNISQGDDLLGRIADLRIKRYADWTVKRELYDITILKLLESKTLLPSADPGGAAPATPAGRRDMARRFAQLYSHAIQRYIKGRAILNGTQRQHLASVLVEVEEKCIGRLLGQPQVTIRRALERDMLTALWDEHNRLLGTDATPGQLPAKLGFDYSTSSTGPARTAPLPLPDPPPQKPVTE
jgi:hypothetical protein